MKPLQFTATMDEFWNQVRIQVVERTQHEDGKTSYRTLYLCLSREDNVFQALAPLRNPDALAKAIDSQLASRDTLTGTPKVFSAAELASAISRFTARGGKVEKLPPAKGLKDTRPQLSLDELFPELSSGTLGARA